MQIKNFILVQKEKIKAIVQTTIRRVKRTYPDYKKYLSWSVAIIVITAFWQLSQHNDRQSHFVHHQEAINFKGGRIIGDGKYIYQRKEAIISQRLGNVEKSLQKFSEALRKVNEQLSKNSETEVEIKEDSEGKETEIEVETEKNNNERKSDKNNQSNRNTKLSLPSGYLLHQEGSTSGESPTYREVRPFYTYQRRVAPPSTISFPVQLNKAAQEGIKVPSGSYLKAKLLTGVEASESHPVPVLLQADFFFVGPNQSKIDLSGCFIIAKSKGNLSIERVEMQATKISCVDKSGRMFERKLSGFMADGVDSSFGIIGTVNSKQSRVAAMAFLSSIVQGVGNAIQQMQTQTQKTPMGGSTSLISGDQGQYMAVGGVSNAASLVTNWYLKHAQNLLPTINIGSGQNVWIILQDTITLPNWYFQKAEQSAQNSDSYSYLSRLMD